MIERSSGCNRMHCEKASGGCGKFFCWRCMGDHGYEFMDFNKDPRGGCDKAKEIEEGTDTKAKAELDKSRIADPELKKFKEYVDK